MTLFSERMVRIKRGADEFLWYPGDRLTLVPVKKPERFTRLRKLWLSVAPSAWGRYKTRKSHLRFLASCGVTDPETIKKFGTEEYMADQQVLLSAAPPPYDNGFDARRRTPKERGSALRAQLLEAAAASRDTETVVHLKPSKDTTL